MTRLRLIGFALPVVLVLVLAAVLAFQALAATRSHREAVQHTLSDYADFAAFILATNAWQELERRLLYAFAPVRLWSAAQGDALPPAAALGRDRSERARCAVDGDSVPTFAKLLLDASTLELAGQPIPVERRRWLGDTLAAVARTESERETRFGHIVEPGAQPVLWAYAIARDTAGAARAAYAKTSCARIGATSIFALALRASPALPPSLVGNQPNDVLMRVQVSGPDDRPIWSSDEAASPGRAAAAGASPGRIGDGVSGEAVWPRLGGMRVRVTIRPGVAESLVIGGLPPSRLPTAAFLLLLALGFAVFAIVQVRRQHELMRLREQFVSSVSHELRTPLQQILVFAELLRMQKLRTEEERHHSIEVVERETHRLMQLVDNVLRFSRAARGEDRLLLEDVDLTELAHETIRGFAPLARTRDVTIAIESNGAALVRADRAALRSVLLNLLDNAVKYGPRGQTVSVRIEGTDARVRFVVEDRGAGIPAADRDRIWQAYQRLEREDDAAIAGSGMGLAIVRDLVTRMGGEARLEQPVEGGARFVVELPRGSP